MPPCKFFALVYRTIFRSLQYQKRSPPSMSFCSFIGEHKRNLDGHCLKLGTFCEDWPTQIQIAQTLEGTLLLKRMKKFMLLMLNYAFIYVYVYVCMYFFDQKEVVHQLIFTHRKFSPQQPQKYDPSLCSLFSEKKNQPNNS